MYRPSSKSISTRRIFLCELNSVTIATVLLSVLLFTVFFKTFSLLIRCAHLSPCVENRFLLLPLSKILTFHVSSESKLTTFSHHSYLLPPGSFLQCSCFSPLSAYCVHSAKASILNLSIIIP